MITDVVIVPGAPLLLPEYQGRTPAAPDLLEFCTAAVREAVASAHHVVVVHATDRDPRSTKQPVGVRIAGHLLAATHENFDVEHRGIAWDATVEECITLGRTVEFAGATTLLVVADGTARRTEKAPGHFDPRAVAVDDAILSAVRDSAEGGLARLLDLDPGLCADLVVAGRAPLQVLAAAVGAGSSSAEGERAAYRVEGLDVSDPFGVLYVVAHLVLDLHR